MKTLFALTGMVDKLAVANELETVAIRASETLGLVCNYWPEHGLYDDDGEYVPGTVGHTFNVEMCFADYGPVTAAILLDDREGDLRLQLALAMEHRADETRKVATALRQHYADEQAQKKRSQKKAAR